MDADVEAKRIMAVSINKLYASRAQRGGMRLHRSLLVSMVMRSARDIYHAACLARDQHEQCAAAAPANAELPMDTGDSTGDSTGVSTRTETAATSTPTPEPHVTPGHAQRASKPCGEKPEEDKENRSPLSPDRHSRKRRGTASVAPDFLPSKRARLEPGEERHAGPRGALRSARVNCRRAVESLAPRAGNMNMAIAAF